MIGHLSAYERETIIRWSDAEKRAEVYTCDKKLMRILDGMIADGKDVVLEKDDPLWPSKEYNLPKVWVKIRPPRVMSEAERKEQTD